MYELAANILKIQRYCVNDGPGIRTTVFLKGCPLRCKWCHNPEAQKSKPELMFNDGLCTACGLCTAACPHQLHTVEDGRHTVDLSRCAACGQCAAQCISGALTLWGQRMTIDEIMEVVLKDEAYYEESGGGVTFSGGEPLQQPEALMALLHESTDAGLTKYLDTCGFAPQKAFADASAMADGILFDLKMIDPVKHKQYTGADNAVILSNFRHACSLPIDLRARFVVTPGVSDSVEALDQVVSFVRNCGFRGEIDLLPYHRMGAAKHRHLGIRYELDDIEPPSAERMTQIKEHFENAGFRAAIA